MLAFVKKEAAFGGELTEWPDPSIKNPNEALIEIKASRPYKDLKRRLNMLQDEEKLLMKKYEAILRNISLGVIFLGGGLLIWRMVN
jgi:hypothetical protein